jgi:hypothetical protein
MTLYGVMATGLKEGFIEVVQQVFSLFFFVSL